MEYTMRIILSLDNFTQADELVNYLHANILQYYLKPQSHSEMFVAQADELKDSLKISENEQKMPLLFTSVGVIEGDELIRVKRRIERKGRYPHLIRLAEDRFYCLSPEYLQGWMENLMSETNLNGCNVVLLQEPEWYLRENFTHNRPDEALVQLKSILLSAFQLLEEWVTQGKIIAYGVLSRGLGYEKGRKDFIPFEVLNETENLISQKYKSSHFRYLGIPVGTDNFNHLSRIAESLFHSGASSAQVNRQVLFFIENELVNTLKRQEKFNLMNELEKLEKGLLHIRKYEKRLPAQLFPPDYPLFSNLVEQVLFLIKNGEDDWGNLEDQFKYFFLQVKALVDREPMSAAKLQPYLAMIIDAWKLWQNIRENKDLRVLFEMRERVKKKTGILLTVEEMGWVYLSAIIVDVALVLSTEAVPKPALIQLLKKRRREIDSALKEFKK